MKPVRGPASSRPKPRESLKTCPRNLVLSSLLYWGYVYAWGLSISIETEFKMSTTWKTKAKQIVSHIAEYEPTG